MVLVHGRWMKMKSINIMNHISINKSTENKITPVAVIYVLLHMWCVGSATGYPAPGQYLTISIESFSFIELARRILVVSLHLAFDNRMVGKYHKNSTNTFIQKLFKELNLSISDKFSRKIELYMYIMYTICTNLLENSLLFAQQKSVYNLWTFPRKKGHSIFRIFIYLAWR